MWTPQGIRPIVTVTGSHQRTCVFGTITIDGKQLFRQYDVFNQYVFLKYLKELQRKFRKLLLFGFVETTDITPILVSLWILYAMHLNDNSLFCVFTSLDVNVYR
jgi:hypothetical protein